MKTATVETRLPPNPTTKGETMTSSNTTNLKGETMSNYKLSATYLDGDIRCHCERSYALGEYAASVWHSRFAAEDIAEELREDVGDVVHDSVEYEVINTDEAENMDRFNTRLQH